MFYRHKNHANEEVVALSYEEILEMGQEVNGLIHLNFAGMKLKCKYDPTPEAMKLKSNNRNIQLMESNAPIYRALHLPTSFLFKGEILVFNGVSFCVLPITKFMREFLPFSP